MYPICIFICILNYFWKLLKFVVTCKISFFEIVVRFFKCLMFLKPFRTTLFKISWNFSYWLKIKEEMINFLKHKKHPFIFFFLNIFHNFWNYFDFSIFSMYCVFFVANFLIWNVFKKIFPVKYEISWKKNIVSLNH